MAEDIQSNIKVNIDTSAALASIRTLQSQISAFHTQMAKSGAQATAESRNLQQNLINSINSSGKFAASMTTIKSTTEQFTTALEKNQLSIGQYFRYAGGASKTFGKNFKTEFETINKVARERVKDLQSQYISLGRNANGALQAIKVRPLMLDLDNLSTKTQIAAQKQQLLNQLLKQGSTNLLNFGKNTQWAGRQLMVGFSVPLAMFAAKAGQAYMQMEQASVQFKRVYGDSMTTTSEANKALTQVKALALEYTKYGVAVKDTMDMAASAAAMGKKGADLLAQVASASKLSALGGVDQQKSLQTTISLTNAFGISSKDLGKNIDFLNAVENQTVLNIDDMTTAIPKAAPVVRQLGGDVKDLAFFLTAMKEGGINASEGANALKSGLASMINPTSKAKAMLQGFGINITDIVNKDKGNLKKTVIDFATALDQLDPLNRARAIEQMFGKFQFSRLSTLFKNVVDQNGQAAKVMELAGKTPQQLAYISQKELDQIQGSTMYKFQAMVQKLQQTLVPIGEQFLKIATPVIDVINKILGAFNNLPDSVKNFGVILVTAVAGIGPVLLMTVGLIANGIANLIKMFANVKAFFNKTGKASLDLGSQTTYMTKEQIDAAAVGASLEQVHYKLQQRFTAEAESVDFLTAAYERSIAAQRTFQGPIMSEGGTRRRGYATGGIVRGPGTGTSDSIPAMLSHGEAVIPAKSVEKYSHLIPGIISGILPGYAKGGFVGRAMENARNILSLLGGQSAAGLDPRIAFKVSDASALETLIREGQYKSMFHGVRSTAGDTIENRQRIEQATMGVPMMAGASRRPVYGFLTSAQAVPDYHGSVYPGGTLKQYTRSGQLIDPLTPEQRAQEEFLRLINPNNRGLQSYGSATVYLKPEALAKATVSFGDTLTIWEQALKLGKKVPLVSSLLKTNKSALARKLKGSKDILTGQWAMPYVEAHIPGGFSMQDVEKIGISGGFPSYTIKRMEEVQQLLNENGLGHISVFDIGAAGKNASQILQQSLQGYATGGMISGPGTETSDSILARVSNGEAVIPAKQAQKYSGLIHSMISGNLPGFKDGRPGSGASGRIGKSNFTFPINYRENVSNSGGALDVHSIAPNLENMAYAYAPEILKASGIAQSSIVKEIDAWKVANKNAINIATQAINAGVPAQEAFAELSQKFAVDMETAGGPVHQFGQKAKQMFPQLTADFEEMRLTAKQMGLNVRNAEDNSRLLKALPNNMAAQSMNKPGNFGNFAKLRGASLNILGRGASAFSSTGIPNFMMKAGQDTKSIAYALQMTQEHIATTLQQSMNKIKQVLIRNTQSTMNDVVNGVEKAAQIASPSKKATAAGANIANSAINAIKSQTGNAETAGKQVGIAIVKGARRVTSAGEFITPGKSQSQQVQKTKGGRVATQGGSFLPGSMIIVNPNSPQQPIEPGMENVVTDPSGLMRENKTTLSGRIAKGIRNAGKGTGMAGMGASMALGMASSFLPGPAGEIAGTASMATGMLSMLPMFPKLSEGLATTIEALAPFAPELLVAGAAIGGIVIVANLVAEAERKRIKQINAFGDAVTLSSKQLKTLGDFFQMVPNANPLASATILPGTTQNESQRQSTLNLLQQTNFKTDFQDTISTLKDASSSQVKDILTVLTTNLRGQGFTKENIQTIINGLKSSSGQTGYFDASKVTAAQATDTVAQQISKFKGVQVPEHVNGGIGPNGDFGGGYLGLEARRPNGVYGGGYLNLETRQDRINQIVNQLSSAQQTTLATASKSMASILSGFAGQFDNGTLNVKDFNAQFVTLNTQLNKVGKNNALLIMNKTINALPAETQAVVQKLGDVNDQLLAIKAISLNIYIPDDILTNLNSKIATVHAAAVAALNKLISGQETAIAALTGQETNTAAADIRAAKQDRLNTALSILSKTEEGINKKYDARLKKLDEIQKANDKIIEQQQGQLSLADALSKGDMSAAASAMANIQSTNAKNASDAQRTAIENSRTNAINSATVTVGGIKYKRSDIQSMLDYLDNQGLLENLNKSKYSFASYKKLPKTSATGGHIVGAGTGTSDSIPARLSNGEYVIRANAVKTIGVNTLDKLNQADRIGFKNGGYNGYGNGGLVPSYFAAGGAARGTDIIPAMLTPGEFVIRKSAVDRIGASNLHGINSGNSLGDSVYNNTYAINVNVSSMSNPNDIANVVMRQIKQIDNQRVRGNRL